MDELSNEEICENICKQNPDLKHDDQFIKVALVKKMKTRYFAIVELDVKTFNWITNLGKINIGWTVCRVFEFLHIMRCYNCCGYKHKAENCRNEARCIKCAKSDHKANECTSGEAVCINCTKMNEKLQLNLDVGHCAYDSNCAVYQKQVQWKQEKLCYEDM